MADAIGGGFARILATLEDGEPRAEFGYGMKSRDLRRYLGNLDREMTDMSGSFAEFGKRVQEAFMGHFTNEEGPDPLSGQLTPWPKYNMPEPGKKHEAYITRKIREGGGSKMMRDDRPNKDEDDGRSLYEEIMDPSNIKMTRGNNPGVSIESDVGYGIFGHTGFTGPGGRPTPDQTRRTIFDLTPEEENDIINGMMDEFFRRTDE